MINYNSENINPVGKRLLVKPYERPTVTEGGLEISDTATNSAPVLGEVIKSGLGSAFQPGQWVMYRRYAIDELKIPKADGEDDIVCFLDDTDVLAVVGKVEDLQELRDKRYSAIREKKEIDALNKENANVEKEKDVIKDNDISKETNSKETNSK